MNFKGYSYEGWKDYEEDNIKIFHDVRTPEGKTISMPFSPYCSITQKMFEQWILIGTPTAQKCIERANGVKIYSNWTEQDLKEAFNQRF
jgi:hypothetical protein